MISKRGSSYGVAVSNSGLKRKVWVGTFSTRRAAKEAERGALQRRRVTADVTCDAFATRWQVEYARPAAATRRTYRYAMAKFAEDFAGVRLTALERPDARAWSINQPQSNVFAARAMFNDAINDGLHPGPNPFAGLRLPQSRGRKDITALTAVEVEEIADVALAVHGEYGVTFRAVILFAAYVGLRPGELSALERRDVGADEVTIRQSLDGTGQLKSPKNGKARVVILPPPARDALRTVPPRLDVPWLFVTGKGRPFRKSTLHYYWNPVRAAYGRPGLDFYELRHFCATHLLELGVSHADVAVQLGHTDGGALVMSTYGHPSEDGARERLKRAYAVATIGVIPPNGGTRTQTGRTSP